MNRFLFILAPVLLGIIQSVPSQAQSGEADRFKQFIAGDLNKGLVLRALSKMPPSVYQKCPTLKSENSEVAILRPVSMDQNGVPSAGAWRESFPVSGCGNDTILNLYFFVGDDRKINTVIAEPGASHADIRLQNDAKKHADLAAAAFAKTCKSFDVKNTNFEGYGIPKSSTTDPGPKASLRPWWETWTMVGCGRIFDVPVGFVPEGAGTRIYAAMGLAIKER
jgi:hypothetical protein